MFPRHYPWVGNASQVAVSGISSPAMQARGRLVIIPSPALRSGVTWLSPSQAMQREVDWLAMRLKLHARPSEASPPPPRPPPPSSPPLRRPTTADLMHPPTRLKPPPSPYSLEASLLADLQHLQRRLTIELPASP
jgi:hypothetical protein